MPDPIIGRLNTLRATTSHPPGMMLDGGSLGEILLPKRYVPDGLAPGGEIEVFLLNDSEDRLVATTDPPLVMAGGFALLKVVAATRIGAFLDWGMPKDLLLPFSEQSRRLNVGDETLVHVYLDPISRRLVASTKLGKFVADTAPAGLIGGTRVSLLIAGRTDLGLKAIVDDRYWGLLHGGAIASTPLAPGERRTGYVSRVTGDGLVDLTLEPPGYRKVPDAAGRLEKALAAAENGFLPLHDKSPPERVREVLGMSKKVFKQAVGALYRAKRLRIEEDGIHWLGGGD